MAIKFYLNNNEIKVNTNASFTSTQDESLDGGNLVLEWNETANAIAPRTKLKIVDEENDETWNFVVLSDNVSVVSKIPAKYQHTLTISQNTHETSHYLLRPSTFQQPLPKSCKTLANGYMFVTIGGESPNYTYTTDGVATILEQIDGPKYRKDRIHITSREKVSNAVLEIKAWYRAFNNATIGTENINANIRPGTTRNWVLNRFNAGQIKINCYSSESATTPIRTRTVSVGSNDKVILPKDFFSTDGWYEIEIVQNSFVFSTTDENISFTFTSAFEVDKSYPTIQVYFDFDFNINTYYYSLYDVLNYIRLQARKRLNGSVRQPNLFTLTNRVDELKDIVAPEFKFNGQSVFDAINEVFSYIDAVPTLTENNELDFEYLNDFNGEQVDINNRKADINTKLDDSNYANELVTTYQNAKQPTAIFYPCRNLYKKFESDKFGIVEVNDYFANTDKPIQSIKSFNIKYEHDFTLKLKARIEIDSDHIYTELKFIGTNAPNKEINLIGTLFESNVFGTLQVGDATDYETKQSNSLYYANGGKQIYLGTYTDQSSHVQEKLRLAIQRALVLNFVFNSNYAALSDLIFESNYFGYYYNIEYYATFSGQTMVESIENKASGQIPVGQTSSSVALNKMGSNMLGIISKLGNEQKVVTLDMSSYGSRIRKGSIWVDDNGYKWIANTVKTTFSVSSNHVINEVEFVKNFNSINRRTQIDKEIRFYEIDNRLTSKGYENVNEFIYFSTKNEIESSIGGISFANARTLIEQTLKTDSGIRADFATVSFNNRTTNYYIPLHTYGVGNVICFEMDMEASNTIGNYIVEQSGNIVSKPTIIEDFCDTVQISIKSNNGQTNGKVLQYPVKADSFGTDICTIEYDYYKKLNEIFHLNYGIAFLPVPSEQIYFGENFIANNLIIPNSRKSLKYHFFVSTNETYGINDKKPLGEQQDRNLVVISIYDEKVTIRCDSLEDEAISWCLTDEDYNILIACNEHIEQVGGPQPYWLINLYYGTRKQRIL